MSTDGLGLLEPLRHARHPRIFFRSRRFGLWICPDLNRAAPYKICAKMPSPDKNVQNFLTLGSNISVQGGARTMLFETSCSRGSLVFEYEKKFEGRSAPQFLVAGGRQISS